VWWLVLGLLATFGLGHDVLATGSGSETLAAANDEGMPARGEPWDLVYMADSTGWGVAAASAERAQAALGVEVRVRDLTQGGLRMREMLDIPPYAERLAEAEIIVVFGNPRTSGIELPEPDIETCVSTSSYVRPPRAVSGAVDAAAYRETLGHAFDRIWALREGNPTVFRAADMYSPVLGPWEAGGVLAACTRGRAMMSDQIRAAADPLAAAGFEPVGSPPAR
jgi:hypothetical protein